MREYGPRQPLVTGADYDARHELDHTLAAHYRLMRPEPPAMAAHYDADLVRIVRRNAPGVASDRSRGRQPSTRYANADDQKADIDADDPRWSHGRQAPISDPRRRAP